MSTPIVIPLFADGLVTRSPYPPLVTTRQTCLTDRAQPLGRVGQLGVVRDHLGEELPGSWQVAAALEEVRQRVPLPEMTVERSTDRPRRRGEEQRDRLLESSTVRERTRHHEAS